MYTGGKKPNFYWGKKANTKDTHFLSLFGNIVKTIAQESSFNPEVTFVVALSQVAAKLFGSAEIFGFEIFQSVSHGFGGKSLGSFGRCKLSRHVSEFAVGVVKIGLLGETLFALLGCEISVRVETRLFLERSAIAKVVGFITPQQKEAVVTTARALQVSIHRVLDKVVAVEIFSVKERDHQKREEIVSVEAGSFGPGVVFQLPPNSYLNLVKQLFPVKLAPDKRANGPGERLQVSRREFGGAACHLNLFPQRPDFHVVVGREGIDDFLARRFD